MRRAPLRVGFALPFEEAIAAARARKVELPEDYYRRAPGVARRAATTISGLTALDQVQAVIDSLDEALAAGDSFGAWARSVAQRGWSLPRGRVETVFRTNVQTAYAQGHWRAYRENQAHRPYLMWSAINDSRVRPAHLEMDGHIAPIDDPIWQKWHPPAGYNCRCTQISLTEEQAKARGYGRQLVPRAEPDPGFEGGEPGSLIDAIGKAIAKRWEQCELFSFGKRRRTKPVWCLDDRRWTLQRVERQLEDRTRHAQPEAVPILEFALAAAGPQTTHAQLVLGPVIRANEIADATSLVLVDYVHTLDNYGIRHALNRHGDDVARPLSPYDFLRVDMIVTEFDRVVDVGVTRQAKERQIRFEKRIGDELFSYTAAVRIRTRQLVTQSMWVRRARG